MKRCLALLILSFFGFTSCNKTVENIQQDLVIQAMTSGEWAVTRFTVNGTDITQDFTGYRFKYFSNRTVDALLNGNVQATGNWDGNAQNMTTWANFPGATHPLALINGTWHIDRNSWTYVEATQTGTETRTMRLEKQ